MSTLCQIEKALNSLKTSYSQEITESATEILMWLKATRKPFESASCIRDRVSLHLADKPFVQKELVELLNKCLLKIRSDITLLTEGK
jgi:hypothetical protein